MLVSAGTHFSNVTPVIYHIEWSRDKVRARAKTVVPEFISIRRRGPGGILYDAAGCCFLPKVNVFRSPCMCARATNRETKWEVCGSIKIYSPHVRSAVDTLAVRDQPRWYLMSIRSVVSNIVQPRHGGSRTRKYLSRLHVYPHGHVICTHTRTHTHAHIFVHELEDPRIDSLFEDILDCDSNDCHLFVPSPIRSIRAPVATN